MPGSKQGGKRGGGRKRPSRLGRGLNSLMAQPVPTTPSQPAAPPADSADSASTSSSPATQARGNDGEENAASGHAAATGPGEASSGGPATPEGGLRYVSIESIRPNPHQPRQQFDENALRSLAGSIQADGLMQPIVVRPARLPHKDAVWEGGQDSVQGEDQEGGAAFELVAGERRWRAAGLAGLTRIPAIVRQLEDRQLAEFALIENLQREDLNPLERAEAFQRLGERFDMSHDQIGERVGMNRATISNFLRLLDLSPYVQQLVRDNLMSMGQARALAGLSDFPQQDSLAKQAVREGLSVREVEKAVRRRTADQGGEDAATGDDAVDGKAGGGVGEAGTRASHFADLERQIGEQLDTRVAIRAGRRKGAGKLTIDFYSLDQFDALLDRLGVRTQ